MHRHRPSARVALAASAGAAAALLLWRCYRSPRRRVARLCRSMRLDHAHAALALANDVLPGTRCARDAHLHLAAVQRAGGDAAGALATASALVGLVEAKFGPHALELVPALHAKADQLVALEEVAQAAEQLARARSVVRAACGENSFDSAAASFNLAHCLVHGARSEAALSGGRCAVLLEQATALCLEACSLASVGSRPDDAARFAAALLEALDGCGGAAAGQAASRLRDAYLEAAGREYVWEADG